MRAHSPKKGKRLAARPQLPAEVVERLDDLFPREALQEALEGLSPDEITRPGGLITTLAGRSSRPRCRPS